MSRSEFAAAPGLWKLRRDLRVRMGITSFGLPAGTVVAVTQLDKEYGKVLVEVGPRLIDWMAGGWLEDNFYPLAPQPQEIKP